MFYDNEFTSYNFFTLFRYFVWLITDEYDLDGNLISQICTIMCLTIPKVVIARDNVLTLHAGTMEADKKHPFRLNSSREHAT